VTPRITAIYVFLFVALLAQPHVLRGHVLLLSSAWAQTLSTATILGAAATTYVLHRMSLRRAERRRATLQEEKQRANEKLLDSFRYIGTVNRRLPLLQEVTTDVLRETPPTIRGRRAALQRLLRLAVVTTARAPWGHLRFVDRRSGRTVGELDLAREGSHGPQSPIGNADLLTLEASPDHACERPGRVHVRWSTDRWAPHQTFLILGPHAADAHAVDTLQSLLDQAHVLFAYFAIPAPTSRSHGRIAGRGGGVPSPPPPALATTP